MNFIYIASFVSLSFLFTSTFNHLLAYDIDCDQNKNEGAIIAWSMQGVGAYAGKIIVDDIGITDIEKSGKYDAMFNMSTLKGEVDFDGVEFSLAEFFCSTFENKSEFRMANFKSVANFHKSKFNTNNFTLKNGYSGNFNGAKFWDMANFVKSTFEYSLFSTSQFKKGVHFDGAVFGQNDGLIIFHGAFLGDDSNFNDAKFENAADFTNTEFGKGANFNSADFKKKSKFTSAEFGESTNFNGVKFRDFTYFNNVTFGRNTRFEEVEFLKSATFENAKLQGVSFRKTSLTGIVISNASFWGCMPDGDKEVSTCPDYEKGVTEFRGAKDIHTMVYDYSNPLSLPLDMFEVRNDLRKTGSDDEANAITYFLKHGELEELRIKLPKILSEEWVSLWSRYWGFEQTVQWGMKPNRAILVLLPIMILISTVIYFSVMCILLIVKNYFEWRIDGLGDLMVVTPRPAHQDKEGLIIEDGQYIEKNIYESKFSNSINNLPFFVSWMSVNYPSWWPNKLQVNYQNFKYVSYLFINSFWFSVLSAFHFGWRDLNVGNWLARIQPKAYTYRPTGILRVFSGIQSLCCIYFVAIWALTTFGHPWG